MASYTIYITLMCVLFVIHLPYPLTASEQGQSTDDNDDPEKRYYEECYKRCIIEEHRFPCQDKKLDENPSEKPYECGPCLYPITSAGSDSCKVIKGNYEDKQKLVQMIIKRDQGTGIEVDTGNAQQPSVDQSQSDVIQANAGAANQGEAAAESQVQSQQSSAAEVIEEPQPNEGSVILLEEWQFILIVCGCVAVAIIGVAVAFICWYKIQTTSKAQNEAEYPAYGVTGPGTQISSSINNGDRKLAQSAQMYHYQHQKQQMIAMEKREKGEVQRDASDYDSEEENEDGDLTVYECPGLAPTGEMQVKNPLFAEDAYPKPPGEDDEEQTKQ